MEMVLLGLAWRQSDAGDGSPYTQGKGKKKTKKGKKEQSLV